MFTVRRPASESGVARDYYVSTVQDQGFANAGDYVGKLNEVLRFGAGEVTKTVTLTLAGRDLAFFDDLQRAWVAEAGAFEVLVGASSADIRARAGFTLAADFVEPV